MLSRDAAREVDRLARERYGIPSICLMENAARALAEVVLDELRDDPAPGVLLFCGPGNNGGDGFAAARHLHNAGVRVCVIGGAGMGSTTPDARCNLETARRMGLSIVVAAPDRVPSALAEGTTNAGQVRLVVDALFGTGLTSPIDGLHAELVDAINVLHATGVRVIAADVPSGLDAQDGRVLSGTAPGARVRCVGADVTVTFAGLKPGLCELEAQEFVGDVVVVDIGVPLELLEELGTRLESRRLDAAPRRKSASTSRARRKGR
jgi:NAD(P)H-hydrate epimerase